MKADFVTKINNKLFVVDLKKMGEEHKIKDIKEKMEFALQYFNFFEIEPEFNKFGGEQFIMLVKIIFKDDNFEETYCCNYHRRRRGIYNPKDGKYYKNFNYNTQTYYDLEDESYIVEHSHLQKCNN